MTDTALGVYVHFPYCVKKCPYCDFATQVVDEIPHEAYADRVIEELGQRRPNGAGRKLTSVYFGGGTPSLWAPPEFTRVLEAILEAFEHDTPEITVEANPGLSESSTLSALREAGANRVSFGTQSFHQESLDALGRWHQEEDSFSAVERARAAGFDRVSLDLIYAVPGQTPKRARDDIRALVSTAPDHVSAYCLTLDAKVPMAVDVAAGRVRLRGHLRLLPAPHPLGVRQAAWRQSHRYYVAREAAQPLDDRAARQPRVARRLEQAHLVLDGGSGRAVPRAGYVRREG